MSNTENGPSSVASPEGRRILIAVVTGTVGERIQAWRMEHDPAQSERIPPHTTLCYWAPTVEPAILEAQVRHAFASSVTVRLGEVHEFDNDQRTFYVEILDTAGLDEARDRLYDGTHVALPGDRAWTWHVTCVRESRGQDPGPIREAAQTLALNEPWRVDRIEYMELRVGRYESLASWQV